MSKAEAPFKATLKAGGGYEAPWVTVDGDTAKDLEDKLDSLTEGVLQKVAEVAELLRSAHTVVAGVTEQPVQSAQGATVTQHPASTGLKTCEHGVRVQRSGNGKKGPWTGYFCALPKGTPGACDVVWGD